MNMNAMLMSKFGPVKDKFSLGITDLKVSQMPNQYKYYFIIKIIVIYLNFVFKQNFCINIFKFFFYSNQAIKI